jgi:hypothetical protein
MKRIVCIAFLLTSLALIVVVPAQAASVRVQTSIEPDGTGSLYADSSAAPLSWEACSAELTGCRPFARGREAQTTGAPAGTVFRLKNGAGESGLSPEWRGPPKELAPPRVAGAIQANGFVSPVPGLWSGGWQGEDSEMQLSACATEAGMECVSITSPQLIRPGCASSASVSINPRFAGMYLRVADKQSGGPHFEAAVAVYSPSGTTWGLEPVWGRDRTTSIATVGQIAAAVNPSAGECGPAAAPVATISAEGVARVECAGGCSVVLTGTRKGRRQIVTRRIAEQSLLRPWAALEMGLPRSATARLGTGKVRLTVKIDGTLVAQRTVRTPAS